MNSRFSALAISVATTLSAVLMLSVLTGAAVAQPAKNTIVIDLKAFGGDDPSRWEGSKTVTSVDDKKYEITVYHYQNTVTNRFMVVCILKDKANDNPAAITFARLLEHMSTPLQCHTYSGTGANLQNAVKEMEQSMQNLVGNALTVAVTDDGPKEASRFTMRYKK